MNSNATGHAINPDALRPAAGMVLLGKASVLILLFVFFGVDWVEFFWV